VRIAWLRTVFFIDVTDVESFAKLHGSGAF
jgi:hypothetical protein